MLMADDSPSGVERLLLRIYPAVLQHVEDLRHAVLIARDHGIALHAIDVSECAWEGSTSCAN